MSGHLRFQHQLVALRNDVHDARSGLNNPTHSKDRNAHHGAIHRRADICACFFFPRHLDLVHGVIVLALKIKHLIALVEYLIMLVKHLIAFFHVLVA